MFRKINNLTEKEGKNLNISFEFKKKKIFLIPMGYWILKNEKFIKKLNLERRRYNRYFLCEISNDLKKTLNYLKNILENNNICLFLIKPNKTNVVGIVGLKKREKIFEIYFVLKLIKNPFMFKAMNSLINWSTKKFKIKNYIIKVFSNNKNAKKFYRKIGFKSYYSNYLKRMKINKLNKHIIVSNKMKSNVKYFYQTLLLKL